MKGLSKKEIEMVADLEFRQKYYFLKEDIKDHFKNKKQLTNTIYSLRKKERIIRLNKDKYFLVPIKSRTGKWSANPYILADEIFNGEGYFIGGWAAANTWRLTDQIPMQFDIYTTKRQGKARILNTRFVFHRTTENRVKQAEQQTIQNHPYMIMNKEESKEWIKSRI